MSHIQLLPFRGSLAIEGDPQESQPNQKRGLQRAVGAQRSGRQEEISPRREALVGLSGWLVALGICCCTRAFSLVVARRGSSLVAAHRLSLQWLLLLQSTGSRAHSLQQLRLTASKAQAQYLWHTGNLSQGKRVPGMTMIIPQEAS